MIDEPMFSSLGEQLKAARESKGWSQQDVCDQLNLGIDHIKNLEAENYAALPPPAFVKGYIRGYAKLVDIEPQMLISLYNETEIRDPEIVSITKVQPERISSDPLIRGISVIVAAAMLAALAMWWFDKDDGALVTEPSAENGPESTQSETDDEITVTDDVGFPADDVLFKNPAPDEVNSSVLTNAMNTTDIATADLYGSIGHSDGNRLTDCGR